MSDSKNREALGRALVEATQETTIMAQSLIKHLVGRVVASKNLSEAEQAHVAANQMLVLLSVINHHLGMIGDKNFECVMRQVQVLIDRERVGGTKVAGLSKLSALLLPLMPLKPGAKN